MARLKTVGFETGDSTEIDSIDGTLTLKTDYVRSGTYSCRSGTNRMQSLLFSEKSEVYAGMGIYINEFAATVDNNWIAFRRGTTSVLEVAIDPSDWSWRIQVNGVTVDTTAPGSVSLDTWHYVELGLAIDEVVGWAEVKIDGVSISRFDGDTGTNLVDRFSFRAGTTTTVSEYRVDDIIVNDSLDIYNNSWVGQPRLVPAAVSGSGSRTELSRGGVDSGANWSQVSPIPASATGYVTTTVAEEGDSYVHAPFASLPPGAVINNLIVVAQARIESGAGVFTTILKSGAMDEEGEIKTLSSSFRTFSDAYPVDEGDVPWTLARANDVEVGILNKDFTP
jgi:hypothetical protein